MENHDIILKSHPPTWPVLKRSDPPEESGSSMIVFMTVLTCIKIHLIVENFKLEKFWTVEPFDSDLAQAHVLSVHIV